MKAVRTTHNTLFCLNKAEKFCHEYNATDNIISYEIRNNEVALRHGNLFVSYSPENRLFLFTPDPYYFELEYNENSTVSIRHNGQYLSSHPGGSFVWRQKAREWEQFKFDNCELDAPELFKRNFIAYMKNNGADAKLACACGTKSYGPDWFNTDYYEDKKHKIHFLDLCNTFPFPDNSFKFIYCEHGLEHLEIHGLINFFNEAYRVLGKGGALRFAQPSLDKWLKYYLINDDVNDRMTKEAYKLFPKELPDTGFQSKALVFNNALRNWAHKLLLDFKTYKNLLLKAGFTDIYEEEIFSSRFEPFKNIESRNYFYNNFETTVIEACK